MTSQTTTGVAVYYPEMGEAKPEAKIEASLGHYGKHYYLKSEITLSGRGIQFLRTLKASDLVPTAQHKAGWHEYRVTIAAYDRICKAYLVSYEMLLD